MPLPFYRGPYGGEVRTVTALGFRANFRARVMTHGAVLADLRGRLVLTCTTCVSAGMNDGANHDNKLEVDEHLRIGHGMFLPMRELAELPLIHPGHPPDGRAQLIAEGHLPRLWHLNS